MEKYRLIKNDKKEYEGRTLYRIKANRDIGEDVKKGDLGGYLSESCLISSDDDSWVYDDAMVIGSVLRDNATAKGDSIIINSIIKESHITGSKISDCIVSNSIVEDSAASKCDVRRSIIKGSTLKQITDETDILMLISHCIIKSSKVEYEKINDYPRLDFVAADKGLIRNQKDVMNIRIAGVDINFYNYNKKDTIGFSISTMSSSLYMSIHGENVKDGEEKCEENIKKNTENAINGYIDSCDDDDMVKELKGHVKLIVNVLYEALISFIEIKDENAKE